jgi:cell division protease FtsH
MFEWKSEQEADMMVSLASLVGERMFFEEDNSTGVGGDLHNATALATRMEGLWGMGGTIGSHSVSKLGALGGRQYTAEDGQDRMLLETELGKNVETKLRAVYDQAHDLLEANRQHVLNVAHALETEKTVSGDDIVAIIEGTPGPLIDGRPYHEPAFLAAVESYHATAVQAHQEHDKMAVGLPLLAPAVIQGDGHGNGEVPARPDVKGNGEVRRPTVAEEDGAAGSVEAGAGPAEGSPAGEADPES